MRKEIRDIIKMELHAYDRNKQAVAAILPQDILLSRQLFWTSLVVQSIELALWDMPHEVAVYARLRYFSNEGYTQSDLEMKLNTTERTIRRWDAQLIASIARYMGIWRA